MHFLQLGIFVVCIATSITVGTLLIYLLIAHQKAKNSEAKTNKQLTREIIWAIIPCLILILLISPASITFIHQTI